jgi:hypothetical protein
MQTGVIIGSFAYEMGLAARSLELRQNLDNFPLQHINRQRVCGRRHYHGMQSGFTDFECVMQRVALPD